MSKVSEHEAFGLAELEENLRFLHCVLFKLFCASAPAEASRPGVPRALDRLK
jgi:hypothetical protein